MMTTEERTALVARWEQDYRARRRLPLRERATLEQALATMARSLQLAYDTAGDAYRAALWQRRAWLLERDRAGDVYDGSDAIAWKRNHDAGVTGRSAEDMAAMRAKRYSVQENTLATGGVLAVSVPFDLAAPKAPRTEKGA